MLFQACPSLLMETIKAVFFSSLTCSFHLSLPSILNPSSIWDLLKGKEKWTKWSRTGRGTCNKNILANLVVHYH